MTVVARRIRSTPFRSAGETWETIVKLIAPEEGDARRELNDIAGLAASSITSECIKEAPIMIHGSGPRVRVYCLYGEDALTEDGAAEGLLAFNATEDGWEMSLPCPDADFGWFAAVVASRSSHVKARRASEVFSSEESANSPATHGLIPNLERFFKS